MSTSNLILSLDYELFFSSSGTIEKCLFDPCEALLKEANQHGYRYTFYIDIGMVEAMLRHSSKHRELARQASLICANIESLALAGHEIGLHVHPHWEDVAYSSKGWDFGGARYRLDEFSLEEVSEVVSRYSRRLSSVSGTKMESYRAGGFCIKPFKVLAPALAAAEIWIDSSVVPGMFVDDDSKGVDFRNAPTQSSWRFSASPDAIDSCGQFVEVPVTAQILPFWYYWRRLWHRIIGRGTHRAFGDGSSKRIGHPEIMRRLGGAGRVSELSIDYPKSENLSHALRSGNSNATWHVMGHPKLLSESSFTELQRFVIDSSIGEFSTVSDVAADCQ